MGYCSMLATVLCFQLPNLSSDPVLCDLVRSSRIEASVRPLCNPAWDLSAVLQFLNSPLFEPLHQASLCDLTKKVLFLVALACLILRLGWTTSCYCALSEPSVSIWTGLSLFVLFLAVFFCPLGGLLMRCRRMPFLSLCVRSSMGLLLVGRRWVR